MSEDKNQQADIENVNGETCWPMIQGDFGKMVHCDVGISKAPPVQFINDFLSTPARAEATNKHVMLDQGRGPCGLPQMLKIFKKHNHTVLPTVPDASNQNPVERHHKTISDVVQAVSIGTNLPMKFWPFCSLHAVVLIFNSLLSQGQSTSPIEKTTKRPDLAQDFWMAECGCVPLEEGKPKFNPLPEWASFLVATL